MSDTSRESRTVLRDAGRVVIKLGTRVVTGDGGRLAMARLHDVIEACAAVRHAGRQVLVVSSGAVGLGLGALGFDESRPPEELADRQACAAVGQSRLMGVWQEGFGKLDLVCGQVLLTQGDFDDRLRYLNLRSTLSAMLRRGAVPIINENDAVSTEELAYADGAPVFGDNDTLSALVAMKLDAELLVLLTDVDGVYDADPRTDEGARRISRIHAVADIDAAPAAEGVSRGGMRSKLAAAEAASRAGCHVVIASGRRPGELARVLNGENAGTWFPAQGDLGARRRWIAYAAAPRGALHLDQGAVDVLRERGASLLAAGVTSIVGDFRRGDVVELVAPDGRAFGRGIVHCDAAAARAWSEGAAPPGVANHHALVHRDHMVLEG